MNTDTTRRPVGALLLTALLMLSALPAMAQTTQLAPQAARIADEVIQADLRSYEALQSRIKALNECGRHVRDYFLAKSQCWLDVSFDEDTRNDRSEFPQAALTEAERLVRSMESAGTPDSVTPLVNGATRLRADLLDRAAALKGQAGMSCAQHKLTCAEVELVHAGNGDKQLGWGHAKPYKHDSGNIRSFSRIQLEEAMRQVQRDKLVAQGVRLNGHADRLNGTRQGDYKLRLSEKRVATVKAWLQRLGVAPQLIVGEASGDRQPIPIPGCEQGLRNQAMLQECLLPNRRVDVLIETRRP